MQTRLATVDDVPAITDLVNRAFIVEQFFKIGDRTSSDGVAELMRDGAFVLAEREQRVIGCVFVRDAGPTGYFGMLSIDPSAQGQGMGRAMVEAAEQHLRAAGCAEIEIHIVNLREDLPRFYRRLGYVETGQLPFPEADRASQPCHFIVMRKAIRTVG